LAPRRRAPRRGPSLRVDPSRPAEPPSSCTCGDGPFDDARTGGTRDAHHAHRAERQTSSPRPTPPSRAPILPAPPADAQIRHELDEDDQPRKLDRPLEVAQRACVPPDDCGALTVSLRHIPNMTCGVELHDLEDRRRDPWRIRDAGKPLTLDLRHLGRAIGTRVQASLGERALLDRQRHPRRIQVTLSPRIAGIGGPTRRDPTRQHRRYAEPCSEDRYRSHRL
jgi:hypothetical protein